MVRVLRDKTSLTVYRAAPAAGPSVEGCRARCFDVAWRSDFRVAVAPEKYTWAPAAPFFATAPHGRAATRRVFCAGGMCSATSRAQGCRCSQPACHVVAVFLVSPLRANTPRSCCPPRLRGTRPRCFFSARYICCNSLAPAPASAVGHHASHLRYVQPCCDDRLARVDWGGVCGALRTQRNEAP